MAMNPAACAVLLLLVVLTQCVTRVQCAACTDINCADAICTRHTTCETSCNPVYGIDLKTFTCGACAAGCTSACNLGGPGTCDKSCSAGYIFVPKTTTIQATCQPCAAHCAVSVNCTKGYTCPQGNCSQGYASKAHPSYPGYYLCSPCGTNCLGNCTAPGLCNGPCKPGYGVAPALNDPTKTACYPCATHCSSGCAAEGGYCCDAAAGSTTGTCDLSSSTWIVDSSRLSLNNGTCHVCS